MGIEIEAKMRLHNREAIIAKLDLLGAVREADFEHVAYGPMGVWRHPGREAVM